MRSVSVALLVVMAPTLAAASGNSSQTLALPIVDASGKLTYEKRVFTFPHYYAGASTAAEHIFSRACSKTKAADDDPFADLSKAPYDPGCNRVNPLSLSGITLSFGMSSADEPPSHAACTLTVDVSGAREPSDQRLIRAGLGSRKALVELAIRTLETNVQGPVLDCAIVYTGLPTSLPAADLPSIFKPVASCNATPGKVATVARPQRAIKPDEQKLRDAVAKNCGDVNALLDLAAAVARTAPFDETLALLARAENLSHARTFDRFGSDPAFDTHRSRAAGAEFVQAYRAARGDRCTEQWLPGAKIASVKLSGNECLLVTQAPIVKLGSNQRLSTELVMVHDEKYRPDVTRMLRLRDPSTIVATSKLPPAQFCKPAFFDFELVHASVDLVDGCTLSPNATVLSKSEAEEQKFQLANAKALAEIKQLRDVLEKMRAVAAMKCTPDEVQRFGTCHPGGHSCDSFKETAAFGCNRELLWQFDSRNVDVKANKVYTHDLANRFLSCLATKSRNGEHLYRASTCHHGVGIPACANPFPSVGKLKP